MCLCGKIGLLKRVVNILHLLHVECCLLTTNVNSLFTVTADLSLETMTFD